MSSFRSGLPTPTENWDDDFDFDPSPVPPPSSTSSRTTSSSHPKLLDLVQHEEESSNGHGGKGGNQPRVVESWDDDFDYDPMDWTKSIKGLPAADSGAGFASPYTTSKHPRTATDISQTTMLSQPLAGRSTSSLVSDKTTSRIPQEGAAHQRSFSSMASQSTAHSERRDRKRSSRFPSQASSASLRTEEQSQSIAVAATSPNLVYADDRGQSFDLSRHSLDSKASSTRKLRKTRGLVDEATEGTFRERVASIKRRISGSLSTGPSTVSNSSKSRAGDMPPPPVPASASRTSSLANALPTLKNITAGLPRSSVEFQDPPGALGLKTTRRPSHRETDPAAIQGSPTPTSHDARASLNGGQQSRSISGIASSESDSSVPMSNSSAFPADVAIQATAVSPTLPSDMGSVSSFPSPSPSVTSLASHAGGYGFHLPSPAAGSAYNMFAGQDSSSQRRQVSDSSATSGNGTTTPVSERGVTFDDDGSTPKARKVLARPSERRVSRPSLRSNPSTASTSLNVPSMSSLEQSVKPNQKLDARTGYKADEKALSNFRFGDKTTAPSSSTLPALPEASRRPTSATSSATAPTSQGGPGKTRLTLRRIGSISRRHSRRISDGWRAVSGQSSSPAKIQSSRPDSGSTPSVEVVAEREPDDSRRSVTVVRQSSGSKAGTSAGRSTPGIPLKSPAFGKNTATPPRPKMLSPTSLLPALHPSATNAVMPLTPTAMRSLSQNDSPSTLKVNTTVTSGSPGGNAEIRPATQPRRNSLGDLKIPSRVVSAQKGLKEEIGAMKQFAAGVQDLKALMAQRTILQAKQERLGIADPSLDSEYSQWWSLADLLIQLGETGSLDGNSSGGLTGVEGNADLRRERRITLAADTVLPPSHLSRLANEEETSLGSGSRTSLSESTDLGVSPFTAGNGRISSLWRASTGRTDFSSAQLEQLRVILDKPRAPGLATIPDNSGLMKTIPLPISEPETPILSSTPPAHASVEGLPRSRTAANASQYALGVRPSMDTSRPTAGERKSSRSTMGTLRDFWRGTGGSQSGTPRMVSGKQPRPSLGSIFRRSSQKVPSPLQVLEADRRSGNDMKQPSTNALSKTTTTDDDSQTSSISDWDTPPPETKPSARTGTAHTPMTGKPPPGDDVTITRSDSRKMLAVLGRGHSPSVGDKSTTPIRPDFQIPAFATSPPGVSRELDSGDVRIPLALTPASLPALVDKLRDVTEHCRVFVDTASERLKG